MLNSTKYSTITDFGVEVSESEAWAGALGLSDEGIVGRY